MGGGRWSAFFYHDLGAIVHLIEPAYNCVDALECAVGGVQIESECLLLQGGCTPIVRPLEPSKAGGKRIRTGRFRRGGNREVSVRGKNAARARGEISAHILGFVGRIVERKTDHRLKASFVRLKSESTAVTFLPVLS